MSKSRILSLVLAAVVSAAFAGQTEAASVLFTANNGSASADLDLTGSTLTITLNNLTPAGSTTGAANLLTGLALTPSISGAGFTMTSQSAAQQMVMSTDTTGSVINGAFNPNWELSTTPDAMYFGGFGGGTPGFPIIGPAIGDTSYPNGGSSLTSGPHGEYAYKTATFLITVPGSFSLDSITGVSFLFNTDGSIVVPGNPPGTTAVPAVPLPAAAWSGMMLLSGLAAAQKFRKRMAR